MTAVRDVAAIRLDNALRLFEEFVQATIKHPDAAALRGLERRFAERLQIQPSYWSQIKGRSRQIGERLARQFEQCSHKPAGWMDQPHDDPPPAALTEALQPRDDDERFIVDLVLTYYRRHPQRARSRLLDLMGDVVVPPAEAPAAPVPAPSPAPRRAGAPAAAPVAAEPKADDPMALWLASQAGTAPLRRK